MSYSSIISLKIKAKLLQKAKSKIGQSIALKDAFAIIAENAGYSSWTEMKNSYELADVLNPPRWSALSKVWFSSKKEALEYFEGEGGYLIPYQKQFFVCDVNYIRALGVVENDSDLQNVGRDWTDPKDKKAWECLVAKIMEAHKRNAS